MNIKILFHTTRTVEGISFFFFYEVCIYLCTHVESGSLSLLPRPGILKALARFFFPPSGAKVVMYSSKLIRAANSRGFDNNKTHSDKIHTPTFAHRHSSPHLLYFASQILYSASIFISLLSRKLLMSCVCAFISHQTFILVNKLYLVFLCQCLSALQISGSGYRCRCFPHSV